MRLFILFLLVSCSAHKEPMPRDTLFLEEDKNWTEIYAHELKVALENNDSEAFYFFWPEYLKVFSGNDNKSTNRVID